MDHSSESRFGFFWYGTVRAGGVAAKIKKREEGLHPHDDETTNLRMSGVAPLR